MAQRQLNSTPVMLPVYCEDSAGVPVFSMVMPVVLSYDEMVAALFDWLDPSEDPTGLDVAAVKESLTTAVLYLGISTIRQRVVADRQGPPGLGRTTVHARLCRLGARSDGGDRCRLGRRYSGIEACPARGMDPAGR